MFFPLPTLALTAALRLLPLPVAPVSLPPVVTILRGHLDHAPLGDTVYVGYTHTGPGGQPAKTVLSPKGDFQVKLTDLKAGPASLSYARQRTTLYLSPGDQLQLTLDFPRFDETIRYSGRGAAANNYLAQSLWKFEYGPVSADAARPTELRTPTTTPAEMRQLADTFRRQQLAFLKKYEASAPLPPAFRHDAALAIDLQWGRLLLDFVSYRQQAAKGVPALPPSYFSFLKEMPLKSLDDRIDTEDVMRFLSAYGSRLLPNGPLSNDPAAIREIYTLATNDFGVTKARDRAIYQMLSFQGVMGNPTAVLTAYPTFRAQNRDSVLGREMRKFVRQQSALQVGQPAPGFTLLDENGKKVSLSDFRGKVVYLDFWASWCGPCLAEAPAAVEMKKKFAGRDVVFLYISIDANSDAWRKALTTHPLTGLSSVHLLDDGPVARTYQTESAIPSYWLIGRDGRIKAAPAPRPSDSTTLVAALEQALAQ
jgi:thiol-disulfide isomerase/thioredoxin